MEYATAIQHIVHANSRTCRSHSCNGCRAMLREQNTSYAQRTAQCSPRTSVPSMVLAQVTRSYQNESLRAQNELAVLPSPGASVQFWRCFLTRWAHSTGWNLIPTRSHLPTFTRRPQRVQNLHRCRHGITITPPLVYDPHIQIRVADRSDHNAAN